MGQHILAGNPPLALILRESGRARRISLRVSGLDGKVTLTIPRGADPHEALAFARSKEAWLRAQLDRQPDRVAVEFGARIMIEGVERRIERTEGRTIQLEQDAVLVPDARSSVGTRLQAWLKARARNRLALASTHYATKLGRGYTRLSIRDTRSRWGSCSAQGGLMYSWRLILAPSDVLDYVAAHEVAHLVEMNHSSAFWNVVEQLMPDYNDHRKWLRKNGATLHKYQF